MHCAPVSVHSQQDTHLYVDSKKVSSSSTSALKGLMLAAGPLRSMRCRTAGVARAVWVTSRGTIVRGTPVQQHTHRHTEAGLAAATVAIYEVHNMQSSCCCWRSGCCCGACFVRPHMPAMKRWVRQFSACTCVSRSRCMQCHAAAQRAELLLS
jgi:hypothetical protein